MTTLRDMVKMTVASAPGTGPIPLGIAVTGFNSVTTCNPPLSNNEIASYQIQDGGNWEVCQGAFNSSTLTFSRNTVSSILGTAPINASVNAIITITPLAEDFTTADNNILINPSMDIDQANEGNVVTLGTDGAAYIVDGWRLYFQGASSPVTAQRVTDAPPGFANSIQVTTNATPAASIGANDFLLLVQHLEGFKFTNTAFGTPSACNLSLSFWAKSSVAGIYTFDLTNETNTRSFVNTFNLSANVWTRFTFTVPGDTVGTWALTGSSTVFDLSFNMVVGSNYQTNTLGTWVGLNAWSTQAQTQLTLNASATFQLTGVKLELSSVPTPFVRRDFAAELALCQRYYEKSYDLGIAPGTPGTAGCIISYLYGANLDYAGINQSFKVTKAKWPIVSMYSTQNGTLGKMTDDQNNDTDVTAYIYNPNTNGFNWVAQLAAPGTLFLTGQWVADARLGS